MAVKKIACIGGGSLFFTSAIGGLANASGLNGSELVLYDLDHEKSRRMAATGQRLFQEAGVAFRIRATNQLADALDNADYVLASIGGTGVSSAKGVYGSYYHGSDMYIPGKYGIHQVVGDTGGPAAMMMAFRTIPAYYQICKEMERYCPRAIFINHSNPMAVLSKALLKNTGIKVIGLCHGVQIGIRSAAELLDVPVHELECVWIGTNHYYWFTRVSHQGKDVTAELLHRVSESGGGPGTALASKLSQIYGHTIVYRDDNHIFEFYPFATQLDAADMIDRYGFIKSAMHYGYDMKNLTMPVQSDYVMKNEANDYQEYQTILDRTHMSQFKPGEETESMAELISAMANGRRSVCIVNVPNNGSIPNLPADAIVEVEAVTDSQGVRNLYMDQAPTHLKGILEKRFAWHDLVADAAVKGDRNLALQALLLDEMAIMPDKAEAMLNELLLASRDLLPQFTF